MILFVIILHGCLAAEAPTSIPVANLNTLMQLIATTDDPVVQLDLLRGTLDAIGGRRRMVRPASWSEAYATLARSPNAGVRHASTNLALIFGDPAAFKALRALAANAAAPAASRTEAIESLSRARDEGVIPILQALLEDRAVRGAALRGLAATDHPETSALILKAYPTFTLEEKADAIGTLAARPTSALALLTAIEQKSIPRLEIPAASLQSLGSHTDPRVKSALARVWGAVRPSSAEKKASIADLKNELTAQILAKADRSQGRSLFSKTCASCHTLFDAGGKIGPELTGSQRTNLDYVLSNVVDPGASVAREYQVSVFATTEGRVVVGIIKREDERSVSVQTATELVIIPKTEIESRVATSQSMMPEGLLNGLRKEEIRDLVGYLAGPSQVPLPADTQAATGAR